MLCKDCDLTMVEIDDCGDDTTGHECPGCGRVVSDDDEPCPKGENGQSCYKIDGPNGQWECLMCGREM